jgi:uncharacterized membrane protein YhaH (DUF805 family)
MAGPLRIVRHATAFGAGSPGLKDYWEKLAKLAPSEVTGFYLTFRPMVVGKLTDEQIATDPLAQWWPWIGIALVVFVRAWATQNTSLRDAQWKAVGISAIAFILWVLTMGHHVAYVSNWIDLRIAGILAAVFTFVIPYCYQGDPPQAPVPAPQAPAPQAPAPKAPGT